MIKECEQLNFLDLDTKNHVEPKLEVGTFVFLVRLGEVEEHYISGKFELNGYYGYHTDVVGHCHYTVYDKDLGICLFEDYETAVAKAQENLKIYEHFDVEQLDHLKVYVNNDNKIMYIGTLYHNGKCIVVYKPFYCYTFGKVVDENKVEAAYKKILKEYNSLNEKQLITEVSTDVVKKERLYYVYGQDKYASYAYAEFNMNKDKIMTVIS